MLEFAELRRQLEPLLRHAATATGKPRGLRWKACELRGDPLFALDNASGQLCALVAVLVCFEPIAGGGMEEVEAVSNLRSATAVFVLRRDGWTTDGRVVFNLDPARTLEHFQASLRPLPLDSAASVQ